MSLVSAEDVTPLFDKLRDSSKLTDSPSVNLCDLNVNTNCRLLCYTIHTATSYWHQLFSDSVNGWNAEKTFALLKVTWPTEVYRWGKQCGLYITTKQICLMVLSPGQAMSHEPLMPLSSPLNLSVCLLLIFSISYDPQHQTCPNHSKPVPLLSNLLRSTSWPRSLHFLSPNDCHPFLITSLVSYAASL